MEQPAKVGRKGIDESLYSEQILKWIDDGLSLDDISATSLQKAVGGQYRKAVAALEKFKEGYEAKVMADLPAVPSSVTDELNQFTLKLWREINQATHEKIAEIEASARAEVEEVEARLAECLAMIENVENQLEKAEDANTVLMAELKVTEKSRGELAEKVAALQSDKSHLGEQVALLQGERNTARDMTKQAEKNAQSLTEQLGIERANTTSLTEQLNESKGRITTLSSELLECRQVGEANKVKLDQESAKSRELAERLQSSQSELAQERTEHRRSKSDYTRWPPCQRAMNSWRR